MRNFWLRDRRKDEKDSESNYHIKVRPEVPGVLQQQTGLHIIGESDWLNHGIKEL